MGTVLAAGSRKRSQTGIGCLGGSGGQRLQAQHAFDEHRDGDRHLADVLETAGEPHPADGHRGHRGHRFQHASSMWCAIQSCRPGDVDRAADVCVIGKTVREQLFGVENPVGKVMRVNSLPCKVVATLHPKGLSLSGQDQDDTIILPYTVAQKKLKGITWLDDILCSAVSQDVVKMAGQEATAVLRDRHHLRPEEEDDFNIRNPEDIIQAQLDASKTLTILLIAIASVSLIVGGIGIMNVMLVSVTERTREIGVRVAVGATEAAIQLQFLGESIMLSLVGGAAGVLAGVFGSYLVGQTLGWPIEMSIEAVVVAAMFSVAVGVFFGYYPARKASRLDPIEALRYE